MWELTTRLKEPLTSQQMLLRVRSLLISIVLNAALIGKVRHYPPKREKSSPEREEP